VKMHRSSAQKKLRVTSVATLVRIAEVVGLKG
jgi:DNA-binding CsgD family transcriptional regulator